MTNVAYHSYANLSSMLPKPDRCSYPHKLFNRGGSVPKLCTSTDLSLLFMKMLVVLE